MKDVPSFKGEPELHFIGQYIVPNDLKFQNTLVAGLSSIDYDAEAELFYLLCDDRSDHNDSRFYTAKIFMTGKGIDSVIFKDVVSLRQPGGQVYPKFKTDPFHTADPEAMRYNAHKNELVWSSEGERIVTSKGNVLIDPFVYIMNKEGQYKDSFALPDNFRMNATNHGSRRNGVFEGMSFSNRYKTLWVSCEEPLYEDGERAGTGDSSAWIRLIKYDVAKRKEEGQYFYQIDPVAHVPIPAGSFKVNGVSDILALDNNRLLFVERSFSNGWEENTIRVYMAEPIPAGNSVRTDLKLPFRILILDMRTLGIHIDNIEGVCFGPRLSSGNQTLVFVSDNNFSAGQVTQFLVFELF
jgi:hypothetical protein